MNFNVYLPDDIGERAKNEDLKLSRLLRDAVTRELERRDAMTQALDEPETYEVQVVSEGGLRFTGRITGKLIAGDDFYGIYLTDDKRLLHYNGDAKTVEPIQTTGQDLVDELKARLDGYYVDESEVDPSEELFKACQALGLKPVIDL